MANINISTLNTTEETAVIKRIIGYDLPVYVLATGAFYYIHIPALCCIFLGLRSVVTVMILSSFRTKSYRTIFTAWTKRFVIYLAIFDGGYNVFHCVGNLHYVIEKYNVWPNDLCKFYGFTLAETIMGKNLMVNSVAINAFMLMYVDFVKNPDFGKCDWKLLAWTFGLPYVGATIAGITGQVGPNGWYGYFDGVKDDQGDFCFTTVPLILIIIMNNVMFLLKWKRIKQQKKIIRETVKKNRTAMKKKSTANSFQRATRIMSMFVVAVFIQWWCMALFGVWALVHHYVPQVIHHFLITFTNIGAMTKLYILEVRKRFWSHFCVRFKQPGEQLV